MQQPIALSRKEKPGAYLDKAKNQLLVQVDVFPKPRQLGLYVLLWVQPKNWRKGSHHRSHALFIHIHAAAGSSKHGPTNTRKTTQNRNKNGTDLAEGKQADTALKGRRWERGGGFRKVSCTAERGFLRVGHGAASAPFYLELGKVSAKERRTLLGTLGLSCTRTKEHTRDDFGEHRRQCRKSRKAC